MRRQKFKTIKRYLHLNDNAMIDASDKMYKLRPFLDALNKNFQKFGIFHSHLSIDEIMIRYYGMHSAKMFMKGKPIKFGYKFWCLWGEDGYLYNFAPYLGKENEPNNKPLEIRVIKNLTSIIPKEEATNYEIFFDNFFTSIEFLKHLGDNSLKATDTIRENRTKKCPLISSKVMEKTTERRFTNYRFDRKTRILVVKWHDNTPVSIATNYSSVGPDGRCFHAAWAVSKSAH